MWSLVTETKVGLDNRTEATPLTIDPQYHSGLSVGLVSIGFRVTKNCHNKVWLGISVENAQISADGRRRSDQLTDRRSRQRRRSV